MTGRVIAIANQKGGVGKSTTAINLATSIAAAGTSTLVIDLDPQGNASTGFGIPQARREFGTYHLLTDPASAPRTIQATAVPGLSIIAADARLAGCEVELAAADRRERHLADALSRIAPLHTTILIDCPPSLGLLTINALTAANAVLVPLQCEFFALEGLSQLMRTIERVRRHLNAKLEVQGIVLTMFDRRNNLSELVAADARSFFGGKVYETVIPRSVRVSEAPSHGQPVVLYDHRSAGAQAYIKMAGEFLRRERSMPPRNGPPRLGKGLAALFGELPDIAAPGVVALSDIEPGPFQPRAGMDEASLQELAESIRSQGVLQPVLLRAHPSSPGRYQIIAGERRWRAARIAGLADMPVLVRDLSDGDAMAAGLVENLQRRDLDAIEEAQGMRRLLEEFGLTQEQLGQALGKSRSHVANTLRLLTLPPSVQEHVSAGRLSAGHARAALAHPDPARAAEAMIDGRLSVRDAERLTLGQPPRERRASSAPPDVNVADLSARLSERLGLVVSVRHSATGNGRVSIHYQSLDQLDALLTLLG